LPRLALFLAMIFAAEGCGAPNVEEQVLRAFFDASRARDNTLLAKVATVSLNPATEGTVRDFEVTHVEETRAGRGHMTKQVTVRARLHTPRGQTVSRMLVFTFERSITASGRSVGERRWMIVDVRLTPLPASRTSREESSAPPN